MSHVIRMIIKLKTFHKIASQIFIQHPKILRSHRESLIETQSLSSLNKSNLKVEIFHELNKKKKKKSWLIFSFGLRVEFGFIISSS
jgi:hypothetical protein